MLNLSPGELFLLLIIGTVILVVGWFLVAFMFAFGPDLTGITR